MLQVFHSSQQQINSEGDCVFSISFKLFFRITVQKQKKYSNVFKQLWEKSIKFMFFSPAALKIVYDKKENNIFLCFLCGFNSFGRLSHEIERQMILCFSSTDMN